MRKKSKKFGEQIQGAADQYRAAAAERLYLFDGVAQRGERVSRTPYDTRQIFGAGRTGIICDYGNIDGNIRGNAFQHIHENRDQLFRSLVRQT